MRGKILTLLLAAMPVVAGAQTEPPVRPQALPRDVQQEIVDRWNGANAIRTTQALDIAAGRDVAGNVAVRRGPLTIRGHVTGSVLAINSDVVLLPDARIDGELLVVGGEVEGQSSAHVGGAIRIYHQPMVVRDDGDRIALSDADSTVKDNWWRRLEYRHEGNWTEALRVVQAGPYNRVEGLPIELGPAMNRRTAWGSIRFDAAAVIRTGSTFNSDGGDFGDRLRTEVRIGQGRGIGVGLQGLNVIEPVENWQMSDLEVAFAAFLSRRDYRDYYNRKGGNAFVTLYGARDISLTGSYGEERWSSRILRNPFTMFNGERPWRANPAMDEGLFHLANLRLRFDTRTDPDDPWAGWYADANVELGRGSMSSVAAASTPRLVVPNDPTDYTRGFFDVRRYNRLGPAAQLNMRVLLGGWLSGDQLPLERRLSVDGPGTLPGFGFRGLEQGVDVATCSRGAVPGQPAECDRIALAQIEYRGDLGIDIGGDWSDWPRHYHTARGDVKWVLFMDAARGWNVGQPDGVLTYDSSTIPSLSTFRSDIGVGLDFSGVGVYVTKAMSAPQPVKLFMRLRHRF